MGYALIFPINNITLDITGSAANLNNGNINYNITKQGNNFNFIGNPYPSPIDWDQIYASNNSKVGPYIYFFKPTSLYFGAWGTYSAISGGAGAFPHGKYIPSMQSFYLNALGNTSITFTNTNRTATALSMGQHFYKKDKDLQYPTIRLNGGIKNGNAVKDEMLIYVIENATTSNNILFDAIKLYNTDPYIPNIYSIADNTNFIVKSLPEINENSIIPLGFSVNTDGEYSIKASEISNIPNGLHVYLYDTKAGIITDLTLTPEYTFHFYGTDNRRFYLKFIEPDSRSHDEICYIHSSDNNLFLDYYNSDDSPALLHIYNIAGQKVKEDIRIKNGSSQYNLSNLKPGIYLINVKTNKKIYNQKILINR
jgi:hypothetical protein